MKLEILQIGNPVLEKPADSVKNIADPEVQKLINDMLDTCRAGEKFTAGLAAPQVGKSLKITIIRRIDREEKTTPAPKLSDAELWEVIVNPEIVELDTEKETLLWEACLSVGKGRKQLYGPVYRPNHVKIRYQNALGETKELEATGYFSHVIQHELDHLEGILFLARVTNPERNIMPVSEFEDYLDKYNEYPPIK